MKTPTTNIPKIDDRRVVDGKRADDRRTAGRDRRSSPRVRTLKGAQIIWPNGAPVRCIVRNISETGAKLEAHEPVLQNNFDLVFDLDNRAVRVT
jgi:hypothetical protein